MSDDTFHDYDPDAARQPQTTRYPGREVSVLYDRARCMHAAECGRAGRSLFDGKRHKWIEPDNASPEEVAAVVARCPSGALRLERGGQVVEEPGPAANTVLVSPDGPLFLRGTFEIDGAVHNRAALCRCGASANKPYCDNTHVRLRFKDAGPVNSDAGEPPRGGKVTVTAFEGGPYEIAGPCTLVAASGRAADTSETLWLCRCGNSGNKPYCDGSHNTKGFRSVE
ncbi:MAG: CDGSH iron-sulfur domain-containing protein [Alphaproteobacteria bacterium]|nr:CDGSH iron-sulfur domain-containing protein [Alphaproteobacteria bacterium]